MHDAYKPMSATTPLADHPRLFGLGSVALAGLIGGPIATGWLVTSNARDLKLPRQTLQALAFFSLATVAWFYVLFNTPPDAISQLVVHLPQVPLWWLLAFLLLRHPHTGHKTSGGAFRSAWSAFGIGVLLAVAGRVACFLVVPVLL